MEIELEKGTNQQFNLQNKVKKIYEIEKKNTLNDNALVFVFICLYYKI